MPEIKTVHDQDSYILPHIDKLRDSQAKGNQVPNECHLNEIQGHGVDIRED